MCGDHARPQRNIAPRLSRWVQIAWMYAAFLRMTTTRPHIHRYYTPYLLSKTSRTSISLHLARCHNLLQLLLSVGYRKSRPRLGETRGNRGLAVTSISSCEVTLILKPLVLVEQARGAEPLVHVA